MLRPFKIQALDITEFLTELHLLLKTGTLLPEALALLQQDQDNARMQTLTASLHDSVQQGASLAQALSQYPQYFESFIVDALKTAHDDTALGECLTPIVNYRQARDRQSHPVLSRLRGIFNYFLAVLALALLLLGMMSLFVIPVFADMFQGFGADLPGLTQAVLHVSEVILAFWWLFLILGIVIIIVLRRWASMLLLALPIVGGVYHKLLLSRLFRSFGLCLSQDMPLSQAMSQSADGVLDSYYAQRIRTLADNAQRSSDPFAVWKAAFPRKAAHIMTVGQHTQQSPALLATLADHYQQQVDVQAEMVYRLGTALITVVMGLVIGVIVLAMYLPIFKMGSVI